MGQCHGTRTLDAVDSLCNAVTRSPCAVCACGTVCPACDGDVSGGNVCDVRRLLRQRHSAAAAV